MANPLRGSAATRGRGSPFGSVDGVLKDVFESRLWYFRALRLGALAIVFMVVCQSVFHLTIGNYINGATLGILYGILAIGIILIYRSLRIINFATAALGAVPAIFAFVLDIKHYINYVEGLPIVLIGGALAGALSDIVVMRKLANASRLIATVVTLGIAQSFAILAFFIPIWLGLDASKGQFVPTPWDTWKIVDNRNSPILTGNQVFALASVAVAATLVWAFLRYTKIGIALRAASENSDRAGLLGIPVRMVQTVAWTIAGALAALAIYGQGPLIGIPRDTTLGFETLLYGLAAAVMAGMEGIWFALAAGVAIGFIIFGSVANYGDNDLANALMLILILGALVARRGQLSRAYATGVATWREVKMFRKVPSQLVRLPEVRFAKWALTGGFVAIMVALPFVLVDADVPLLTLIPIYGIVAVSLVILTGWAGQISLGQFGIVGMAAGVSGGLVANHHIDFFAALGVGIGVGAISAVLIGLPALRIQGLYLAVTTLAFGYVVWGFMLNNHYWVGQHIMPAGYFAHVDRPCLYGLLCTDNTTAAGNKAFYFVCLALLLLSMLIAAGFRRLRSGRILIAARDNSRAAAAFGINVTNARLAAFAVSGGIAGIAGVMFAYQQHNVIPDSYQVPYSVTLFLATAVGGLGSLPTAVISTMSLEATVAFAPRLYQLWGPNWAAVLPLLLTGPLLVIQLMFYPGGLAEGVFKSRDDFLRAVAARRKIHVPSLVADRKVEKEDIGFQATLSEATQELEHEHTHSIVCPVCGEGLTLRQAATHEHLLAQHAHPGEPAGAGGERQ